MSDLFTPPRYFRKVPFHRHTDRGVGWLELFYDLVYVATLIQIGNFLSKDVSLQGFAQFLMILVVVWWSWTGETFYQNRFFVDDLTHRLLVFVQIIAIATLGLSVSKAFGDLYIQFTLAYVVNRLMLVIMYIRAYKHNEEGRHLIQAYMIGFAVGIIIWLGSLLLPAEYHWVGWLIGIAVELSVPLSPIARRGIGEVSVDNHHISERFGIFTIIVLGESFVKILDDAQGTAFAINQATFTLFGMIVVYGLWWLYFSDTAGRLVNFDHFSRGAMWVYGHLPLSAGLVAFAVGAKKAYASTLDYPGDPLAENYRLIYAVSVALYLIALGFIDLGLEDRTTTPMQSRKSQIHFVSAIIVLIIGFAATGLSATPFVFMIAIVMAAQIMLSVILEEKVDAEAEAEAHH